MARRAHDPDAPRKGFHHAKWHDWWVCKECGAVVEDWPRHDPCPTATVRELLDEREASYGLEDAVARARAEGAAGAEFGAWRGAWREIGAMFASDWAAARRLVARRRSSAAAAAAAAPVDGDQRQAVDKARGELWERMGPLINRTTGGS